MHRANTVVVSFNRLGKREGREGFLKILPFSILGEPSKDSAPPCTAVGNKVPTLY
jgi:hypothetical protein